MRKSIFILLILASVPLSAQVDRQEVRAGNRDFKKDKFRAAEVDYRKALLKDSLSVAGNYNLASALYREENFEEAGKALQTISKAASDNPDYYFNLGDVALKKQDYGSAVKAFKEALLRNPGDIDAKENYIYAKKMLQNQQDQNQNQDQNQDQQNQDQNQDQNQQNQDQNQDQQNQDQNQQNQDRQPQPQDQKISPQQAQQILKAVQAEEQKTQEKVGKEKAAVLKSRQKDKNW